MTEMIEYKFEDFDFSTIEEELLVDGNCSDLLKQFHDQLLEQGVDPHRASELAFCVDYYLRDYLMDALCRNVLLYTPGLVRCFAGTWYITRTFEPEQEMIERHLEGILLWYRFLEQVGLLSRSVLQQIEQECVDREWYAARLDGFLNLAEYGYKDWENLCCPDSMKGGVVTL